MLLNCNPLSLLLPAGKPVTDIANNNLKHFTKSFNSTDQSIFFYKNLYSSLEYSRICVKYCCFSFSSILQSSRPSVIACKNLSVALIAGVYILA